MNNTQKLKEARLSPTFKSRETYQNMSDQGLLAETIANTELPALTEILEVLRSEELHQAVDAGVVTLGMIKPTLVESTLLDPQVETEDQQSQRLIEAIHQPLQVIFDIVLKMDRETVEQWYAGAPRESQSKIPPIDPHRYGLTHQTRWDEYVALMERGPITFLLLLDEQGNAVQEWRTQMGEHWNVETVKQKFPQSLRAVFAKDVHNNLVHGSDSPKNAWREINLLADLIAKYIASAK